jgi:hypothetical protein
VRDAGHIVCVKRWRTARKLLAKNVILTKVLTKILAWNMILAKDVILAKNVKVLRDPG